MSGSTERSLIVGQQPEAAGKSNSCAEGCVEVPNRLNKESESTKEPTAPAAPKRFLEKHGAAETAVADKAEEPAAEVGSDPHRLLALPF